MRKWQNKPKEIRIFEIKIEVLAREMSDSKSLVFNNVSDSLSNEKKKKKNLLQITVEINAVSFEDRTCTDLKKQSSCKNKAAKNKKQLTLAEAPRP